MILLADRFDKYTFFWNGPFSQWYISDIKIDGLTYNCCEQYMMAQKGRMFQDMNTTCAVMETPLPREQKALGRQVKNFNAYTWGAVARDIVYRGNVAKFEQNKELEMILEKTAGTLIVEASPYDTVWGIGMGEAEAVNTPHAQWRGTNWLGQVITEVRLQMFGV